MRFKDVPIFYTPYISFPLGDERKSGVLFPSLGHSGSNGFELEVPYYFNLAPNYDLTVTPGMLTARGVQLAEDFRYLTASSHGQLDATFLPNDKQQDHEDRSYVRYTDITDIQHGLRFDADIASVSDSNYFESFAVGTEQTSVTYLERRADLLYYDDVWRIRGQLQNFQTIDISVPDSERPYSRVPRVQANALYPIDNSNFEFAFDSEAVNFLRGVGPTGVRLNLSPEIRWSSRGPGISSSPRSATISPSTICRMRVLACRARRRDRCPMRAWTRAWCSSARRALRGSARKPWNRGWSTATFPIAIKMNCRYSTADCPILI